MNGNNCLDKNKVRVRIKDIKVLVADDGSDNEQLYGGASVFLYNNGGKKVMADGKTLIPDIPGANVPSAPLTFAKESAPLILKAGKPKDFGINEQGKYADLAISNLDMVIEVKVGVKEKDDFGDDTFITDNKMKRSLRKMLIEGSTSQVFEFRHDNSVVQVTVEVTPLY